MRTLYPVAVHLCFLRGGEVLLLRRFNTGWEDGLYSVPAGHVDEGETVTQAAIREAREETGVTLQPHDLSVVHIMHRRAEHSRIDFFLSVARWLGEIRNGEPNKCDALAWFPIAALPDNTIAYVRSALQHVQAGTLFSEFGW